MKVYISQWCSSKLGLGFVLASLRFTVEPPASEGKNDEDVLLFSMGDMVCLTLMIG